MGTHALKSLKEMTVGDTDVYNAIWQPLCMATLVHGKAFSTFTTKGESMTQPAKQPTVTHKASQRMLQNVFYAERRAPVPIHEPPTP